MGVSPAAVRVAISRLTRQKLISSPARGFYVIVPPEYREIGSLPADQFIPELMAHLGLPYYVGLLSAAQYHGAAHQRPQQFQVFLSTPRRPIALGRVRIAFIVRKNLNDVPTQIINTSRGTMRLSTPESTALDLVGYHHRAGGLNNVANVLTELAERLRPELLVEAAKSAPMPWVQRLGYLLDTLTNPALVVPLKAYALSNVSESTMLLPGSSKRRTGVLNKDWMLYVNADVEVDL
jgi:predicted transcriptional regulator of viral defense system